MARLKIGIAGATGALGKEILEVLDEAPWRPDKVVPLASAASEVPFVEYGGEQVAVDDLQGEALDDLDALILAVPAAVALEAGERAIAEGVLVIDCSGAFADRPDVPIVVPWVNPEVLQELPLAGVLSIPGAAALLLSGALGPLRRAGIEGPVEATVLLPASVRGRAGMEELSAQVIALFNQGTPPRKVFAHGLAFDLLPQVGEVGPEGWTDQEARVEAELRRLLGTDVPIDVTLVGVPLFSGVSAEIHLRAQRHAPLDLLERVLQDGGAVLPKAPGSRYLPRPRRVEGHPFVHVGRIRPDRTGNGFHLWASMDNLRGAAATAVATTGAVLKLSAAADA